MTKKGEIRSWSPWSSRRWLFSTLSTPPSAVAKDTPAHDAGLKLGDIIKSINGVNVDKVIEVQEISTENKGKEVTLTIQRGKKVFDVPLFLRENFPDDQGPMGVALFRTALKRTAWYKAPIDGIKATGNLTVSIVKGWGMVLGSLFRGEGVPEGVEIKGAVGIFELFSGVGSLGINYFLQLVAIIAISLALINSLPIPALDGGWFLFLIIERIKGKPLNDKIIPKVSLFSFILLVILMIWITIKDIIGLF